MSMKSFKIQIPGTVLDDLQERLERTRWPDEIRGAGWDYGTNLDYLKRLVDYWHNQFDWRAGLSKNSVRGAIAMAMWRSVLPKTNC